MGFYLTFKFLIFTTDFSRVECSNIPAARGTKVQTLLVKSSWRGYIRLVSTVLISDVFHLNKTYTVNLCLVTIKYKNPSCTNITVPQKYVFDLKKYIFPINTFTFHRLENISWKHICLLDIWITWFQKELATPRFKIPHMNFKKEILVPFRKILVPFRTTKDCHSCRSLFLVWHMCTLNWDLGIDSFVRSFCISFDGPVAKYLLVMQGGLCSNPGCYVYNCFIMTSLGA